MQNEELPRRERERLAHRREILAAALELFSEKGYHNVSMREIAEKSEFAVGTIYKFFNDKEDLYKSLMIDQADAFHDTLTRAIQEPADEVEKLRNYVKAKRSCFMDNLSVIRLYFAETRGASFNIRGGLDSKIRERYDGFLHILASVFESGIKRRRFKRTADPYHLAIALDSLSNAFLFLWLEAPEHHPYPEDPDVILNILFRGLLER
ncbi:MAG: TetR/AcrR family transcriptional regulator [Deltaproteobacteria bacterium]|nr:TetR/AcrR family transcriptional regulator [Deltaproteobacteria bacterium]MBW2122425.1 TetR/AcrR family transcriptional regulator [Deltaproteobacteria bacterium]